MFRNLVLMPDAAELNVRYSGCWIFLCNRKISPRLYYGMATRPTVGILRDHIQSNQFLYL